MIQVDGKVKYHELFKELKETISLSKAPFDLSISQELFDQINFNLKIKHKSNAQNIVRELLERYKQKLTEEKSNNQIRQSNAFAKKSITQIDESKGTEKLVAQYGARIKKLQIQCEEKRKTMYSQKQLIHQLSKYKQIADKLQKQKLGSSNQETKLSKAWQKQKQILENRIKLIKEKNSKIVGVLKDIISQKLSFIQKQLIYLKESSKVNNHSIVELVQKKLQDFALSQQNNKKEDKDQNKNKLFLPPLIPFTLPKKGVNPFLRSQAEQRKNPFHSSAPIPQALSNPTIPNPFQKSSNLPRNLQFVSSLLSNVFKPESEPKQQKQSQSQQQEQSKQKHQYKLEEEKDQQKQQQQQTQKKSQDEAQIVAESQQQRFDEEQLSYSNDNASKVYQSPFLDLFKKYSNQALLTIHPELERSKMEIASLEENNVHLRDFISKLIEYIKHTLKSGSNKQQTQRFAQTLSVDLKLHESYKQEVEKFKQLIPQKPIPVPSKIKTTSRFDYNRL